MSERERESERVSERARERESERTKERESKRAREQESKRARERERESLLGNNVHNIPRMQVRFPSQAKKDKSSAVASEGAGEDGKEELASKGGVVALAPAAQALGMGEEVRTHLVSVLSASSI